jgi:lipoprotein-anchoring transpeptidase ErfK/SrfK
MLLTRASRRVATALVVAAALLAVAVAAAIAYDHGNRGKLAKGVRVGSVDVGGLSLAAARQRLIARTVRPLHRTVQVRAGSRTFSLSAGEARVRVDVDGALARAQAASRRGWLGARVLRELSGGSVSARVPLPVRLDHGAVSRLVARVAATVDTAPVDAKVTPQASGLQQVASRTGRRVDTHTLRLAVLSALRTPSAPAAITAPVATLRPKVTTAQLAGKYPAYIIVDRKAHVLRFYQHLQLDRTYPIAVGRAGLETPTGLYDVQWKEVNPPWRVPNSAWAGSLAGKVIPPGPQDPIKARWMAFDGGAGIHGIDPSEYGSIGHDASHGCVRMRIPDVIDLYAKTPVHTPVYVA